ATRAGDGAVTGAVLVARDDRELKQAQARVRMSDRLAGVGTIAAGVAHELNNPLAFVLANLDFALEELEDVEDDDGHLGADRLAELLRALVATRQGAQRMRQIVRDLKTLSRVDLEANSTIALPPVVDSALNMLRNEIRHHARLVRQYQQIPTVRGNEGRLVQVFVNLIQNAAQAMPAGRADDNEIRVSCTTAADGAAVVEIQDTGDGIADADLPRIFDAFYTTKAAGIGTGLGLSISHEIVTGLGGRIEVASVVGRGTTFRVVLPPATRPGAHPSPHATPNDGSRRLRLLVVDDEPEIGHAAVRTLGRDHDVVVVHRGADALRLVAHERFDAILCDVMMPEMTGVELLDRLQVGHPELVDRVVFMTGGAFSPGAAELLARSARPRIDKPFDLDEVRRVLGAVAAAAGAE
ncbi:MAG: response regulator, partial [Myxococcales bacterium]|nr:response regulator [Myxococcales bacterium]